MFILQLGRQKKHRNNNIHHHSASRKSPVIFLITVNSEKMQTTSLAHKAHTHTLTQTHTMRCNSKVYSWSAILYQHIHARLYLIKCFANSVRKMRTLLVIHFFFVCRASRIPRLSHSVFLLVFFTSFQRLTFCFVLLLHGACPPVCLTVQHTAQLTCDWGGEGETGAGARERGEFFVVN